MMTIDDEGGRGGVLANDDVITEINILCKFLGFYMEFFKIFLQFFKIFLQISKIFLQNFLKNLLIQNKIFQVNSKKTE